MAQMKEKWNIRNKPLADFMPTILLKATEVLHTYIWNR
jgi:DNA-damage-inducible protein D